MTTPGAFARAFKCDCCRNPWNAEDATVVSKPVQGSVKLCEPCLADNKGYTGIDPSNFDASVRVADNFYLWSNGGWKTKNPIPAEYSSWNTFIALRDLNLERLKAILDELDSSDGGALPESVEKVRSFFKGFMAESAIEAAGVRTLAPILSIISNIRSDFTGTVAKLHSNYDMSVFFSIYSSPDKANSEHSLCNVYQGGLGLPDRDYYFDKDKSDKREKYILYIAQLLNLLASALPEYAVQIGDNTLATAQRILQFETKLAGWHLTRTEARDPQKTFNKVSIAKLSQMSSETQQTWGKFLARGDLKTKFHWPEYFSGIGKSASEMGDVNVACVNYLTRFPEVLDSSTLVPYLIFHALNRFAPHLNAAFVQAHFDFHETVLKGTAQMLPRWKRALQAIDAHYILGESLGQLYAAKYFNETAKQRALYIVESVRSALAERLQEVDWMISPETRSHAEEKMRGFKVKIGYPDNWQSSESLTILPTIADGDSVHVLNLLAVSRFGFQRELQRMNAPTDKTRWFMTPQTVNAYYHPSMNEIVFPAAILQPPFFDPNADLAVQFGSLGAVVGHEMTHGFDDQGRKYDAQGNLRDWWSAQDGVEYTRRAQVMINQAAAFTVYDTPLNGQLTQGENIADLGGIKLALRALTRELAKSPAELTVQINGLTPLQRFFIAWSQSWRENVKKERALQLVTLDPHGPNEWRCNGPLSNIAEFHEAFGIQPGDPMYRAVEDRVDIW